MPVTNLPWLHPADEAANYLKGIAIGQQAAEAQARLQEQQNRVAMEAQIHQQTLQQKSLEDAQRIQVTKADHDAEIGLQQQRLQEVQQVNAQKARDAAIKLSAQARFNKVYQETGDVQKALFESNMGTPQNVIAARRNAEDLGAQRTDLARERLKMQQEQFAAKQAKQSAPRRIGEKTVTDMLTGDKTTQYMFEGQQPAAITKKVRRLRYDPNKGLVPVEDQPQQQSADDEQ